VIVENGFDVDAPIERGWALLCDIPQVAACIPNAELTEVVDAKTYRVKVAVKAGPVAVDYRATVTIESLDEETHTATMAVQGEESRGRGGVRASIVACASARGNATHVDLRADAQISGIVATLGGRLIEGVAKKTVAEFAANLAKRV